MCCAGHVRKELRRFEDRYRQYTPPQIPPLQFLQSVYAAIVGADHLVQAMGPPTQRGSTYTVNLQPVGVAYRDAVPQSVEEAKLAIKGVLMGCDELHTQGECVMRWQLSLPTLFHERVRHVQRIFMLHSRCQY